MHDSYGCGKKNKKKEKGTQEEVKNEDDEDDANTQSEDSLPEDQDPSQGDDSSKTDQKFDDGIKEANIAMETVVSVPDFASRSCTHYYFKGKEDLVDKSVKNIRDMEKKSNEVSINILDNCPNGGSQTNQTEAGSEDELFQRVTSYNY